MDRSGSKTTEKDSSPLRERRCNERYRFQQWRRLLSSSVCRCKIYYMMGLYASSFFAGWVVGLKGPAFLDLLQITGVGTSKGAAFFTAAAVGAVVGNLVGGALYDRYNRHIVLFFSSCLYGVTCVIIPWCSVYWTMVFIFFVHELVTGAARSGTSVEIVEEWGDRGKAFMQALHFSFSLGATVSPFVVEPFLSSSSDSSLNSTLVNTTIDKGVMSPDSPDSTFYFESRVHYAFLVVGVLAVLSSFIFLMKYHYERKRNRRAKNGNCGTCEEGGLVTPQQEDGHKREKCDDTGVPQRKKRPLPVRLVILTILLFSLFYFFLDEVEDTSPSFLSTFVVQQLGWTKTYGSRLSSAFWASYTAGRGFGIIFVNFLTHVQLFSLCCIVMCLGQVGLLLSGLYQSGTGIWISIVTIGLSISVIFPASLTWTEKELMQLSGKLMGAIYVALALGGLANPQIIGITMETFSPMWYSYVLCAESVLFLITFLGLVMFVKNVLSKHKLQSDTPVEMT